MQKPVKNVFLRENKRLSDLSPRFGILLGYHDGHVEFSLRKICFKSELENGVLKIWIQHFPWLFSQGMCQWCLSFRGPAEILWIKERLSLANKKLNCTVHCLQIFGRWRCLICRRGARWQSIRLPGGPNTSQYDPPLPAPFGHLGTNSPRGLDGWGQVNRQNFRFKLFLVVKNKSCLVIWCKTVRVKSA